MSRHKDRLALITVLISIKDVLIRTAFRNTKLSKIQRLSTAGGRLRRVSLIQGRKIKQKRICRGIRNTRLSYCLATNQLCDLNPSTSLSCHLVLFRFAFQNIKAIGLYNHHSPSPALKCVILVFKESLSSLLGTISPHMVLWLHGPNQTSFFSFPALPHPNDQDHSTHPGDFCRRICHRSAATTLRKVARSPPWRPRGNLLMGLDLGTVLASWAISGT